MNNFEAVYETMLGLLEDAYCVPGVENAFAEGSFCAAKYETMRAAYERICGRLGVQEDADLDTMVDAMEALQKELCRRFYERK